MKSGILNVGIIGAGNIAVRHIENLRFLGGNRVAAICDIDEALVRSRCDQYDARGYHDWKDLFAEVSADCARRPAQRPADGDG